MDGYFVGNAMITLDQVLRLDDPDSVVGGMDRDSLEVALRAELSMLQAVKDRHDFSAQGKRRVAAAAQAVEGVLDNANELPANDKETMVTAALFALAGAACISQEHPHEFNRQDRIMED
jgi:hypothetical protein